MPGECRTLQFDCASLGRSERQPRQLRVVAAAAQALSRRNQRRTEVVEQEEEEREETRKVTVSACGGNP